MEDKDDENHSIYIVQVLKYGTQIIMGYLFTCDSLDRQVDHRINRLIGVSGAFFALSWYVQLLNSHEQVRKTLMKSRLSPPGQRPIVCIDEAQVRVFLLSSSII